MSVKPDPVGPGQESVWSYPRPPRAEGSARHLRILHRGVVVADTRTAVRTLETSHPPTWYIPPADVDAGLLRASARRSFCEWKGVAVYFDVLVGGQRLKDVAWSYPDPTPGFVSLKDHIAFYAAPFDACSIDGEPVTPQPGGFYGGWVTPDVAGPFKGVPGSQFW
jgi:uncharacterized protein (DUF427 family)